MKEGIGFGTTLYVLIKIALVLFASLVLIFIAGFQMGAKRGPATIAEWAWSQASGRLVCEMIMTCFFFLFSLLVNLIFRNWHRIQKRTIKKFAVAELSYYFILSLILSVMTFYAYLRD